MIGTYKYRFHPNEYALGETEQFYTRMERRGWRLVKRGTYLSKFAPTEPGEVRYRIEVAPKEFLEQPEMSEEQLAVYADCGWEHVADRGFIYVFRAPAGSDAPEFYTDPRQQAATLKTFRRAALWAWLWVAVWIGVQFSLAVLLNGGLGNTLRELGGELRRDYVTFTAFFLGLMTMLLWAFFDSVRSLVGVTITYRRMRRGIPLDHDPGGRHLLRRGINHLLLTTAAVMALLTVWQLCTIEKRELPTAADGPYILLSDLGRAGERTSMFYQDDRRSQVEFTASLAADCWDVREYVRSEADGDTLWMYQRVYRLRRGKDAPGLVEALQGCATFSSRVGFQPVEFPGFDEAWTGHGLEIIARRGELVTYITCMSDLMQDGGTEQILTALAERWDTSY